MSDISSQLIKDSYNYVLQSDLATGVVYRIGGGIPVNPIFSSGLTINTSFNFSNGTEQNGYVLTSDSFGNAIWKPAGSSSGNFLPLSGGTVTGPTIFTNGLTANTFSASTYLGLPIDIRVTGATKSGSVATFRNNTGGTFTLTGLTDVFVTGGTHSLTGGTTTFRNNTGGTFNVSGYFTPSNDIYVTSGSVDHGPSSDADNLLLLTRSDSSIVTISNLVNISDTTKSEIDSLIASKWIIRGKTYKISGCDNSLYYNGTDERGDDVYTTIYLMGLENNKLSETGVGIFYTPQYDNYDIFLDGAFYTKGEYVIWGGYVWECGADGTYSSIDLFTLDSTGFDIIRPFKDSNRFNKNYYNEQYDDIIYDYTNDRIIYRNEENSNIVSTTYENINYWINDMGLYNPIRAFQWGNVSYVLDEKIYGIGNQRIINSYNENINYRGQFQKYFYFNNLSHQNNLYVEDPLCYQSNFIFDNKSYQSVITLISNGYQSDITLNNGSYQTSISFQGVDGFPSNQSFFNFNNGSYQDNIVIRSGDGAPGNQSYFNFNNSSYQINITLREREQNRLDFTNNSGQDTIDGCNQESLIFDSSTQVNGNGFNQLNITIKNYDRDLSSVSVNEQDEFYIHNLPSDDTAPVYIGKINNRLVEVTKPVDIFVTGGTYTSGNAIFTNNSGGTFTVTGFAVGGGGGQTFYLNLSQSQGGNRLLSTTASTASEQTSGVTISNGVTSTIASFQSQPLNITLLPGGVWGFYLHSYKQNNNASFNIFVEVYKRTSGGTQTLLFTTDPAPVTTNSPNPSMQLSDGYFSGTPLSVSDSIVAVVRATNTGNQSHIITLVTEGSQHYSYAVSTIPTQQGLTCDTLSGCSIIQTIQTDVSNKLDKSGGTITGDLIINSGLTATTISATTYLNLPPSSAKSINSVSINTNAGNNSNTDYIYFASNTITITLPTAISNTNSYVIKNVGTGTITINTTSSQTIDGSLTALINVQYLSLTLISDGANWNII